MFRLLPVLCSGCVCACFPELSSALALLFGLSFWSLFGAKLLHFCFSFLAASALASQSSPRRWRGFLGSLFGAFLGHVSLTSASIFWLRLLSANRPRIWLVGSLFGAFSFTPASYFRRRFPELSSALAWLFGLSVWSLFVAIIIHFCFYFLAASALASQSSPRRCRGFSGSLFGAFLWQ